MENPQDINTSALKRAHEEADPPSSKQLSHVKKARTTTLEKDEHRQLESDDDEAAASDSNDEFSDDYQDQPELQANSQSLGNLSYTTVLIYIFFSVFELI